MERILEDDKLEIEDKMRKAMGFAQKYECKETGSAEMICRSVQAKIRILR